MTSQVRIKKIVHEISDLVKIERHQGEEFLEEFLKIVKSHVAEGDVVIIPGFGTISAIGQYEKSDGRGGTVLSRCRVRFHAHESFKALIDQFMNKKT